MDWMMDESREQSRAFVYFKIVSSWDEYRTGVETDLGLREEKSTARTPSEPHLGKKHILAKTRSKYGFFFLLCCPREVL
jgi:hypothetical protein